MKRFDPKKRAKHDSRHTLLIQEIAKDLSSIEKMRSRSEAFLSDQDLSDGTIPEKLKVCLDLIEKIHEISVDHEGSIPEYVASIELFRTARYILQRHVVSTIDEMLKEIGVGTDEPEEKP